MAKNTKKTAIVKTTPARRESSAGAVAAGLLLGGLTVLAAASEARASSYDRCSYSAYCACGKCRTERAEKEAEEARAAQRRAEDAADVSSVLGSLFRTPAPRPSNADIYARLDRLRKEIDELQEKRFMAYSFERTRIDARVADIESEIRILKSRI